MRLHIALTQAPRSINYHLIRLIRVVSLKEQWYQKLAKIIGKFLKNGGLSPLCMPTIASGLVAIKVICVTIRQCPFDLRIRVAAIAFYKRSVGKYYKMYPYRRSDMISTAAHETAKSSIIYSG